MDDKTFIKLTFNVSGQPQTLEFLNGRRKVETGQTYNLRRFLKHSDISLLRYKQLKTHLN